MKITYTKHAENKFKYAEDLNWHLSKKDIEEAINSSDLHTIDEEENVEIVLKKFDARRNLRVIYTKSHDIITIITFYLVKKGRYEKE